MKQTDKKYWFKRRRYGWGWIPVTWQGWLSLLALIVVAVTETYLILPTKPEQPTVGQLGLCFTLLLVNVAVLIGVCQAKGPAPRWRWGKKSDDNPEEDR